MVARLAGIYGPGRSALLRKFLSGEARLENGGERYLEPGPSRRHRRGPASPREVMPSNDRWSDRERDGRQPITQREVYAWLARKLDRPFPPSVKPGRANENAARATNGCRIGGCARSVGSQNFRPFRSEWRGRSCQHIRHSAPDVRPRQCHLRMEVQRFSKRLVEGWPCRPLGAFGMGTKIESQRGDMPAFTLAATRQPNEGSIRPKSPLLRR